jgi:predicted acyltransferase
LTSIDVFRGSTIAAMILVNSQASPADAYRWFVHAPWNGLTFADTIFPAFLFIVGVSLTLSTAARVQRGEKPAALIAHAIRRSALLFAAGVFIDALQLPYRTFPFFAFGPHLQLSGVLQKIAVCYFAAFLIHLRGGTRGAVFGIVGLNLAYLVLLFFYPVPGCDRGALTTSCNFPGYLDRIVLDGFRWNDATRQDPDGLGTVLPATTSVLFGVLAAWVVQRESRQTRRFVRLAGMGLGLVAAGALLATWIPVNKTLWTTSYAVLTAGVAAASLAVWSSVVEVGHLGRWFRPFEILGLNAVAAYLISQPITNVLKVQVRGASLYSDVLGRVASPAAASMLFAAVALIGVYGVIWLMHRREWYLKL